MKPYIDPHGNKTPCPTRWQRIFAHLSKDPWYKPFKDAPWVKVNMDTGHWRWPDSK